MSNMLDAKPSLLLSYVLSMHGACWQPAFQQPASSSRLTPMSALCCTACRHGLYDSQGRLMLKNLTLPELEEWCTAVGA
jgi:hypothetical protein